MDVNVTEVLNGIESVADETIKVNSVTETSRHVKKQKTIIKDCKVLYWNKDSRNFAFQYEDKQIQIMLPEPLKICGTTVRVKFTDGKYELLER